MYVSSVITAGNFVCMEFRLILTILWGIHKGCTHKFGNFWDPPPPFQACPHLFDHSPPPVRADTRLALFETLQLWNNSHRRVKKLIILFENNVKNILMKTTFEMMSLHCVQYILCWIQAEWKFYIQTYCQIMSKCHKYDSYNFFPSGRPHLANHPRPLPLSAFVHFCLTPLPNVRTSFIGGPFWRAYLFYM